MSYVIERKSDKELHKSPQQKIQELEQELIKKDTQISDLKDQIALVQMALDDIILGGMM